MFVLYYCSQHHGTRHRKQLHTDSGRRPFDSVYGIQRTAASFLPRHLAGDTYHVYASSGSINAMHPVAKSPIASTQSTESLLGAANGLQDGWGARHLGEVITSRIAVLLSDRDVLHFVVHDVQNIPLAPTHKPLAQRPLVRQLHAEC